MFLQSFHIYFKYFRKYSIKNFPFAASSKGDIKFIKISDYLFA